METTQAHALTTHTHPPASPPPPSLHKTIVETFTWELSQLPTPESVNFL